MEAELERMFRETATWLRFPAGVAAAGGIVAVIAAMSSAAVADVTGIVATSAAVIGTFVAFGRRRKILAEYHRQMEAKREELVAAIEQQLRHAIDLFYAEIGCAFPTASRLLRGGAQALRSAARSSAGAGEKLC